MGIDLTLLPLDFDGAENGTSSTMIESRTVLSVPPCSHERQQQLCDMAEPMVRPIASLEGDLQSAYAELKDDEPNGCGTTEDRYGKPLTFIRAARLGATLGRWPVPRDREGAGRLAAIVAYLRALPQRTRVVLLWR